MERTTIAVAPATRDLLKRFGRKGESYDHILHRLLRDAGWVKVKKAPVEDGPDVA